MSTVNTLFFIVAFREFELLCPKYLVTNGHREHIWDSFSTCI